MKNIFIIQGGSRPKGNTAQLAEHFIKGAEEAGHKTELVSPLKNEVKGCLGCNACRYGKLCIQKDSFNEIVPKIKNAACEVYRQNTENLKSYMKRQWSLVGGMAGMFRKKVRKNKYEKVLKQKCKKGM